MGKLIIKSKITVGILTKNAETTLRDTLESVKWAKEIIIVDDHSTDKTLDIALHYTDRILSSSDPSFAQKRNLILKESQTNWLLYIDSDEVVTEELRDEIEKVTQQYQEGAFALTRENYFLGTKMYRDAVTRLFHLDSLEGWSGDVHESPIVLSEVYTLKNVLIHHTHRDITSMLHKTNAWSEIEAQLRYQAGHPPIAWWRLVRMMVSEGWYQFGQLKVGRFGRSGLFEGWFQMIDILIVYTKLWEKQRTEKPVTG